MMWSKWELTDNDCCQHIRENGSEYEMIQAVWLDRTIEDKQRGLVEYCVIRGSINLDDYSQDEIETYLSLYGYEERPENSIVAECILEDVLMSDEYVIGNFDSFDETKDFIEHAICL